MISETRSGQLEEEQLQFTPPPREISPVGERIFIDSELTTLGGSLK